MSLSHLQAKASEATYTMVFVTFGIFRIFMLVTALVMINVAFAFFAGEGTICNVEWAFLSRYGPDPIPFLGGSSRWSCDGPLMVLLGSGRGPQDLPRTIPRTSGQEVYDPIGDPTRTTGGPSQDHRGPSRRPPQKRKTRGPRPNLIFVYLEKIPA